MREILFRGKRISDKKWIEGGIVVLDPDSDYVYISEPYYHASTLPVRELIHHRTHLVDKETVGQYTGLTDKNGKKIFEGDILKLEDYHGDRVVYVFYGESCGCWFYGGDGFSDEYIFNASNKEVIGNIFDNLDLIVS